MCNFTKTLPLESRAPSFWVTDEHWFWQIQGYSKWFSDDDQMLLAWPPRSPDATPCDFFLWGYVKDQIYVPPLPTSTPELKVWNRTAIETITADKKKKKHACVVQISRSCWLFSLISRLLGEQSGNPAARRYISSITLEVLAKLCERVRRKRSELWRNGWILHQDKAPVHNESSVKQFLAKKNITVFEHPPYSPDLAPCDF